MTGNAKGAWSLFGAALAGTALLLFPMMRNAGRRSIALEAAREQNAELRSLENQNRKLLDAQIPAQEVNVLRREHEEAMALRRRLAALQEKNTRDAAQPGELPESETLPAAAWIYEGKQTPKAALESALWSASRGDPDTLAGLLAFSPKVRAGIEQLISQLPPASQQEYGTPEKLVASLMAASLPENISAITPGGLSEGVSDAALSVEIQHADGQTTDSLLSFVHEADGWHLQVPANVASSYMMTIFGPAQPKK